MFDSLFLATAFREMRWWMDCESNGMRLREKGVFIGVALGKIPH
jgi:hypothetical protein